MISMWHKDKFCYETHVVGIGFIAVVGQHINSGHRCFVVNVYAACNFRAKVTLWEDLSLFRGSYQNMVGCFCEDFNAVRREDERKGIRRGSCQRKEMGGFNGFIDTNCLVDIPTVGKNIPGSNQMVLPKVGWIDFLCLKSGFRFGLSTSNMYNKEPCLITVLLWRNLGLKIGALNPFALLMHGFWSQDLRRMCRRNGAHTIPRETTCLALKKN